MEESKLPKASSGAPLTADAWNALVSRVESGVVVDAGESCAPTRRLSDGSIFVRNVGTRTLGAMEAAMFSGTFAHGFKDVDDAKARSAAGTVVFDVEPTTDQTRAVCVLRNAVEPGELGRAVPADPITFGLWNVTAGEEPWVGACRRFEQVRKSGVEFDVLRMGSKYAANAFEVVAFDAETKWCALRRHVAPEFQLSSKLGFDSDDFDAPFNDDGSVFVRAKGVRSLDNKSGDIYFGLNSGLGWSQTDGGGWGLRVTKECPNVPFLSIDVGTIAEGKLLAIDSQGKLKGNGSWKTINVPVLSTDSYGNVHVERIDSYRVWGN